MNLTVTLYDNRNKKMSDISNLVGNIEISSQIENQPSRCTFPIHRTSDLAFWEGATISIICDGYNVYRGQVVTKHHTADPNIIDITCLDQLRILNNKDSYVFENVTSSDIFSRVCNDMVLNYRVVDKSNYICALRVNDNVPMYDMVKNALYETLAYSGKWYIIRDNFGVLEHVNIFSLQSGILIGDNSGIYEIDYTSSIEQDVYNQIKLYRDNKKSRRRELYIVNDSINGGQNIREWGILQLTDEVPEEMNIAQIEERARGMLSLYNKKKRTLNVTCKGSFKVVSGSLLRVQMAALGDLTLDNYLMVSRCVHKISHNEHTMSLDLEVAI